MLPIVYTYSLSQVSPAGRRSASGKRRSCSLPAKVATCKREGQGLQCLHQKTLIIRIELSKLGLRDSIVGLFRRREEESAFALLGVRASWLLWTTEGSRRSSSRPPRGGRGLGAQNRNGRLPFGPSWAGKRVWGMECPGPERAHFCCLGLGPVLRSFALNPAAFPALQGWDDKEADRWQARTDVQIQCVSTAWLLKGRCLVQLMLLLHRYSRLTTEMTLKVEHWPKCTMLQVHP